MSSPTVPSLRAPRPRSSPTVVSSSSPSPSRSAPPRVTRSVIAGSIRVTCCRFSVSSSQFPVHQLPSSPAPQFPVPLSPNPVYYQLPLAPPPPLRPPPNPPKPPPPPPPNPPKPPPNPPVPPPNGPTPLFQPLHGPRPQRRRGRRFRRLEMIVMMIQARRMSGQALNWPGIWTG